MSYNQLTRMFYYNDVYQLTYDLLNAMGMYALPNGIVADSETNSIVQFSGKSVKATINPYDIKYANMDEIAFEPLTNSKLLIALLGRELDKLAEYNEHKFEAISYYQEEKPDENGNRKIRMSVKWSDNSVTSSNYYYNKCLALIELIFVICDVDVNLSNFDVLEEKQQ